MHDTIQRRDLDTLYLAANDEEAAFLDALAVKAGLRWKCACGWANTMNDRTCDFCSEPRVDVVSFDSFLAYHTTHRAPPSQREGQWIVNSLPKKVAAKLVITADLLGRTDLDPFYTDDNLPAFWLWLADNWEDVK